MSDIPRAPLPSRPADGAVTQIQIALNNLIGQLREALFIVPESAPAAVAKSNIFFDGATSEIERVNPPKEDIYVLEEEDENPTPLYIPPDAADVKKEIVERARNLGTLILGCREAAGRLPNSMKTMDDYALEMAELEKQNAEAAEELRFVEGLVTQLDSTIHQEIKSAFNKFEKERAHKV